MTSIAVDVIIPTHNGARLLERCLEALRASTFHDYRLLVFDDGSAEPVAELVERLAPGATVLRSDTNIGLCRALNRAIAATTGDYVALLNDDTTTAPDWLGELVACAERHPDAGSVASKLRLMSDPLRLHSAGDYFSWRGLPGNRGVWLDDLGQFDHEEPVFGACGGAALFRRTALTSVALPDGQVFDERLFMYCEDVDLAWRLQRAGWSCWYTPRALVHHHLSATGGGSLASYYVARNLLVLLASSVPVGLLQRRRVAAALLGRLYRQLPHLREPAARASLRGSLAGLATLARVGCATPPLTDEQRARIEPLLAHAVHE
jgi:GT2 family glycosyltransferase